MHYKILAIVLFQSTNVTFSGIDDSKEKVGHEQSNEKGQPVCKKVLESMKKRNIQNDLKPTNQEQEQMNQEQIDKAECAKMRRKQLMMLISMFLD